MLDNIPPSVSIPTAIVLWLILFAMILRDRRRLNRALKERPSLKYFDHTAGEWADVPPQGLFDQDVVPGYTPKDVEITTEMMKSQNPEDLDLKKEAAQ